MTTVKHLFLVCILVCGLFFPVFPVSGLKESDVHMIYCADDYKQYGFKDFGYYYTSESLTDFYMPLVIDKGLGVNSIS